MKRGADDKLEAEMNDDYNKKVRELNTHRVVLTLSYEEVLDAIFAPIHSTLKLMNVLQRKELPEGYHIRGVYENHMRNAFDFIIVHPSFKAVKEGDVTPQWDNPTLIINTYEVKLVDRNNARHGVIK